MKRLVLILLTLVFSCAILASCRGTLAGDRCDTTADCDPPLRCSNETAPAGARGICVLPEAIPDAAVPLDSDVTADASPTADASG